MRDKPAPKIELLDCTLRDGGYVVDWKFGHDVVKKIIRGLNHAGIDIIECGYIFDGEYHPDRTFFSSAQQVSPFINSPKSKYVLMADVAQFSGSSLPHRMETDISGIRVVFYKHQTEDALRLCSRITQAGYTLFVQPMVTIDYSKFEYSELIKELAELSPGAVAIVDSFGFMTQRDFRQYFRILDVLLPENASIGFHSHNNMQLSLLVGQDVFSYETHRKLIIDCSLYGIGRGAGNLNTELIAHYPKLFIATT